MKNYTLRWLFDTETTEPMTEEDVLKGLNERLQETNRKGICVFNTKTGIETVFFQSDSEPYVVEGHRL